MVGMKPKKWLWEQSYIVSRKTDSTGDDNFIKQIKLVSERHMYFLLFVVLRLYIDTYSHVYVSRSESA